MLERGDVDTEWKVEGGEGSLLLNATIDFHFISPSYHCSLMRARRRMSKEASLMDKERVNLMWCLYLGLR